MNEFKNECYQLAHKHCLCIEFVPAEDQRHGFHNSQLIEYRLELNSIDEKDAPPDKLMVAFATADVVIVGWQLSTLSDHLRDGDLLVVRSRPARYVHLEPKRTFVAEIKINPLKSAS